MKTILTIVLCACALFTSAQENELNELNSMFSGRYVFSLKKKALEIDFVKGGEVYREETMVVREVDWKALQYNEENTALQISCLSAYSSCIDRKIIKTKSRQSYPKSNLMVKGKSESDKATGLLQKLFAEQD